MREDERRLEFLKRVYRSIAWVEDAFVGVGLLATTLIVFLNVLTRYFLSFSYSWSEEVTRYIMIAVAFIGAAICSRKGIHLAIDFFFNILPPAVRKYLAMLIAFIGAGFTLTLTVLSIRYVGHAFETGQRSAAMDVPMIFVYAPITIGCSLMFLHFMVAAFSHWVEKETVLKASEKGG